MDGHGDLPGPKTALPLLSSPLQTGLVTAYLAVPGCVCWNNRGKRGQESTSLLFRRETPGRLAQVPKLSKAKAGAEERNSGRPLADGWVLCLGRLGEPNVQSAFFILGSGLLEPPPRPLPSLWVPISALWASEAQIQPSAILALASRNRPVSSLLVSCWLCC